MRGKREAVSFWKRLQQDPAARDKIVSFWKRTRPHDRLEAFWKRGQPGGAGLQAFWKRFVPLTTDDDLAAIFDHVDGRPANKKNVYVSRTQQQRRAKEMSARRPEFNPTGW